VVKALRINPKLCSTFMKLFKTCLLDVPRYRNIVTDPDLTPGVGKKASTKLLLLSPTVSSIGDLAEHAAILEKEGVEMVDYSLTLDWDYWNSEQQVAHHRSFVSSERAASTKCVLFHPPLLLSSLNTLDTTPTHSMAWQWLTCVCWCVAIKGKHMEQSLSWDPRLWLAI
jgi:hypothetical protein